MKEEKSYLSVLNWLEVNETKAFASVLMFLFRQFCDVDEFFWAVHSS